MTNSNPSTVTALHLRMPNCDIKGTHEIKITPMPEGSAELTLVTMAPLAALDEDTIPFLVSTSISPIATTAASSFVEAAAPNDELKLIDPRLLLGKGPSAQASCSFQSPRKHSLDPEETSNTFGICNIIVSAWFIHAVKLCKA
ncbi:hypothetical protein K439DRAFT_1614696 [Ramaria rubella]|nr:hypothetical protein K439DRAFT_1614696 [Ramaria rubella]